MGNEPIPTVEHKVIWLETARLLRDVREAEKELRAATGLTPELRRALQEEAGQ